jgi:pyrroline-5-carboxylate reductase
MNISFIGGGNMGEAILAAVLRRGLASADNITVSDINEVRRSYLNEKFGVTVTAENRAAVNNATVVVLAVKPQTLNSVLAELKGQLKTGQVVLSIIAGARLDTICDGLDHRQVVRSMPNTPAQIGEGMTVWTSTLEVTSTQQKQAQSILAVMGEEIFVNDERFLDMATAVSGSGPAYVFYFVESFIEAAVKLGFAPDIAEKLVRQTLTGATHLLQQSDKRPMELRRAVTSPGGTTAAAIASLEKDNFGGLMTQAVAAAHQRAKELGK